MKILIIGGTKFLGRHLIKAAQERQHSLTIFNRGKETNEVFPNVEQIIGDRNFDLEKLKNRSFDAVIDTCGYLPQTVKESAEILKNSVGRYVFVSSISAYKNFRQIGLNETFPLAELTPEQEKKFAEIDPKGEINAFVLGEMYGALKALCEKEVEKVFSTKSLIVRPGLIVGEYDWTDRFTYWALRVSQGGEVLAPGNPKRFIQFIDGCDLADWIIKAIENQTDGVFNVTGKPNELTMEDLLNEVKTISQKNTEFIWLNDDFLLKENVSAWDEMPLYLPDSEAEFQGFLSVNIDKALKKGLTFRSLRETIEAVLKWRKTVKTELNAGISKEREKELISKWKASNFRQN